MDSDSESDHDPRITLALRLNGRGLGCLSPPGTFKLFSNSEHSQTTQAQPPPGTRIPPASQSEVAAVTDPEARACSLSCRRPRRHDIKASRAPAAPRRLMVTGT